MQRKEIERPQSLSRSLAPHLMNVKPVKNVDGVEVLGVVVSLQLFDAFPEVVGVDQMLEVRIV